MAIKRRTKKGTHALWGIDLLLRPLRHRALLALALVLAAGGWTGALAGPTPEEYVAHTADPADLLALPAVVVAIAAGWARTRPDSDVAVPVGAPGAARDE